MKAALQNPGGRLADLPGARCIDPKMPALRRGATGMVELG
jgi:hypothetical protein